MPDHSVDVVHEYARRVTAGDIVAGLPVRQLCAGHLNDLATAPGGVYFDAGAAQLALDFLGLCQHSKGRWAGRPLELEAWQQFIVGSVYGWMRAEGLRRYRTVYIEVARKNGKTTKLAGIGNLMLVADGEDGAEVYAAATKRDQARICWSAAANMVRRSPALSRRVRVFRSALSVEATASKFEPLGADSKTLDGLNVSCALIDEVHAHPNRDLYDVLDTATAARSQPLIFLTTTAGSDRSTFCADMHEMVLRKLAGKIEDDSLFGYIATLDKGDDWQDPDVWIKANPNLGVSVMREELQERIDAAKQSPSLQNSVKRLRLNQWTQAETRFLDSARWDQCTGELSPAEIEISNRGRRCFGGLDLATTTDIAAFIALWPPSDPDAGSWDIACRFWIPGEKLEDRERRSGVPYHQWIEEGWLIATPGDTIDYRAIRSEILDISEEHDLVEIAFDRWGSTAISTDLQAEGLTMVEFGQGYASMSPPTKELERMVLARMLRHGGHPILRWMADNLEVASDPAGNIKPKKPGHKMSHKKIDGMVALIMALARALAPAEEDDSTSIYETRGMTAV